MADPNIEAFGLELRNATAALRDFVMAQTDQVNRLRGSVTNATQAIDDTIVAQKEHLKAIENNTDLTAAQNKKLVEANKRLDKAIALETELNKLKDEETKLMARGNATQEELDSITQRRIKTEMELADAKKDAKESVKDLDLSMDKLSKTTTGTNAALRLFGMALMAEGKQLVKQYKASGGVIEGSGNVFENLFKQQTDGMMKYGGVSGEFMMTLSREHRQVFNAMGGSTKALDELNPAIKRMRVLTGDSEKGLIEAAEAARSFAQKGIKPSNAVVQKYTNDLVQLNKYTGMTIDKSREYYDDVANDSDSMDLLRKAREGERESILANQRALINQNLALGMTAQQAKDAAKMLNKMVAAKPLDRIRQAAKIRALGGAMGIAGSEKAAQGILAGPRATAQQKEDMLAFSREAATTMDKMAGQGMASEIFATTLLDKLNLDQYLGTGSPFSLSLADANKPIQAAVDNLKEPMGQMAEAINALAIATQALKTLGGGSGLTAILSGLAGAITTLASVIGAGKLKDIFKGGAGGAAGDAGGKVGKAGKFLKGAGRVGTGALLGVAGDYAGEALAEHGHEQLGAGAKILSAAGSGALMGSAMGPWGTAIGGVIGGAYGLYNNWSDLMGSDTPNIKPKGAAPQPGSSELPVEPKPLTKFQRSAEDTLSDAVDEEVRAATISTSTGITTQVKKMDESNMLLRRLADLSQQQIDIGERQLVAMTMSEKDKTNNFNRTSLLMGNKFGSQYGYV